MKKGLRIGIFGGTFNPIHQGHLAIAAAVRKAVGLDRVLLIPAGRPPHKNGRKILAARHRLEMVRLAVRDRAGMEASDIEIVRRGKSYTIQTIRSLESAYPVGTGFYLILGLDAFLEFFTWRSPEAVAARCHLVVVSRPGFRFSDLSRLPLLKPVDSADLKRLDAGRRHRLDQDLPDGTRLILIRVKTPDVSASRIRDHLSGGKRFKNLLPPRVESYIIKHGFYGRARNAS